MVTFLANAFSLNMLKLPSAVLYVKEVGISDVKELLAKEFISAIGHEATADVLSQLLGIQIPVNRIPIKLENGDTVIVFQLLQRIPEGKILSKEELQQLIQQGQAKFYRVRVYEYGGDESK